MAITFLSGSYQDDLETRVSNAGGLAGRVTALEEHAESQSAYVTNPTGGAISVVGISVASETWMNSVNNRIAALRDCLVNSGHMAAS